MKISKKHAKKLILERKATFIDMTSNDGSVVEKINNYNYVCRIGRNDKNRIDHYFQD